MMRFFYAGCFLCIGCFTFADETKPRSTKISFENTFSLRTKSLERGRLVAKNSAYNHLTVVFHGKQWGSYGDCENIFPLQQRSFFPNRWKISGGILKKATEHFTLDLGLSHLHLPRKSFEFLPHWTESYCGIRSNLLMQPSFYLFWDYDRHQWGMENKFHYEFDLSIFDLDRLSLSWENRLGFWKGRRSYGPHAGKKNCKYRYIHLATSLFLTYKLKQFFMLYAGPTFSYNSGGTKLNTLINTATHRSHFCTLDFGCKIDF